MNEQVDIEIFPDQIYILWDSNSTRPERRVQGDTGWMDVLWEWEIIHSVRSVKGWMFFLRGWHKGENHGRQMRVIAFGKYLNERW